MSIAVSAMIIAFAWPHPTGLVGEAALEESRARSAAHEWAAQRLKAESEQWVPWMEVSPERLREVFPAVGGNVYHNFSDPETHERLVFEPFNPGPFRSPGGKNYSPDTDAGVYPPDSPYHGTMYDGWVNLFVFEASQAAERLAFLGMVTNDAASVERARDILLLFCDSVERIETRRSDDKQRNRIFTYAREGENRVLHRCVNAYELARAAMTPEERSRFETVFLQRMVDDVMFEPSYTYTHNNVYWWYATMAQVAAALERPELLDWIFGYGEFAPEKRPEHRNIRRLLREDFRPDGAYWELCSGYHLYPLHAICVLAVTTHRICEAMPERFPPKRYDLTRLDAPEGERIRDALHWFMDVAPPDRIMPTVGDSMNPTASMAEPIYAATAEAGYRFYGLESAGDYESLRSGDRGWFGLLFGAAEVTQHETPYRSTHLSSGWVSLRSEWNGSRVWAGLNTLQPGGGHQHADRLTLLTWAKGALLTREKATPYNEKTTRELGTLSPMHNTVTVDMTSQPQGETLREDQVPVVAHFLDDPLVKFTEVRGDRLYEQTRVYRRSVAIVEDIVIDCFRVEGGQVHDWMLHLGPAEPALSIFAERAAFEPAAWLHGGTDTVQRAHTDSGWAATWPVGGLTARVSMLGAEGTSVHMLETYPLDNASVTEGHPPCKTLCVRRRNDAPFIAVHDAWRGEPNLVGVSPSEYSAHAARVETRAAVYCVLFGPGDARFSGGTLSTDGDFALVRLAEGLPAALAVAGGAHAIWEGTHETARVAADGGAAVRVFSGDVPETRTYPNIPVEPAAAEPGNTGKP